MSTNQPLTVTEFVSLTYDGFNELNSSEQTEIVARFSQDMKLDGWLVIPAEESATGDDEYFTEG